jgi:hypothetical protein
LYRPRYQPRDEIDGNIYVEHVARERANLFEQPHKANIAAGLWMNSSISSPESIDHPVNQPITDVHRPARFGSGLPLEGRQRGKPIE